MAADDLLLSAVGLRRAYGGVPAVEDFTLTRGDGCFMCRAHGETCDGLEAEWWTDTEWEEFYIG